MNWLTLEQAAQQIQVEVANLQAILNEDLAQAEQKFQQCGIFFDRDRFAAQELQFCYVLNQSTEFERSTIQLLIELKPQQSNDRAVLIAVNSDGDFPLATLHQLPEANSPNSIVQQLAPMIEQVLESFQQQLPERSQLQSLKQQQKKPERAAPQPKPNPPQSTPVKQISLI